MDNSAVFLVIILIIVILVISGIVIFYLFRGSKPKCESGFYDINGSCIENVKNNILLTLNSDIDLSGGDVPIPFQKTNNTKYTRGGTAIVPRGDWNISFSLLVKPSIQTRNFYLYVSSSNAPFVYTLSPSEFNETISGSINLNVSNNTEVYLSGLSTSIIELSSNGTYLSLNSY